MSTPAEQTTKPNGAEGSAPTELGKLTGSAQAAVNAVRKHCMSEAVCPIVGRAVLDVCRCDMRDSCWGRLTSDVTSYAPVTCGSSTAMMHELSEPALAHVLTFYALSAAVSSDV